ncbi:MAG: hypothetical protein P8H88_04550, partial [Flavobacteriales bacterium]|nr:hypothetical protein [Flavobacteriales bacterium]
MAAVIWMRTVTRFAFGIACVATLVRCRPERHWEHDLTRVSLDVPAHRSGRTARAGKNGISLAMMSIKERSHLNRLANTLDINFTQTLVPNPEEIVHARLSTWGQGLIELPVGQGIPDEIWEQMTLLFEGHSKEDLLRQIVLSEMRKLDTAGKADLNQKDMAGRRRDRDDQNSWEGRAPRSHRDKPFAKKRKPTGKSGVKPYSKSAGSGSAAGKPAWEDAKPGKPMGAGKAKKKASKKRPAFKPGQEPWAGKSTGSPGFSVK